LEASAVQALDTELRLLQMPHKTTELHKQKTKKSKNFKTHKHKATKRGL